MTPGYVVVAPSIHPDTKIEYRWERALLVGIPETSTEWLEMLTKQPRTRKTVQPQHTRAILPRVPERVMTSTLEQRKHWLRKRQPSRMPCPVSGKVQRAQTGNSTPQPGNLYQLVAGGSCRETSWSGELTAAAQRANLNAAPDEANSDVEIANTIASGKAFGERTPRSYPAEIGLLNVLSRRGHQNGQNETDSATGEFDDRPVLASQVLCRSDLLTLPDPEPLIDDVARPGHHGAALWEVGNRQDIHCPRLGRECVHRQIVAGTQVRST